MLAFVHRMPCREDDSSTAKDLSKVRRKIKPSFFFFNSFISALYIYICLYFPATPLKRPHRESGDLSAVAFPRSAG